MLPTSMNTNPKTGSAPDLETAHSSNISQPAGMVNVTGTSGTESAKEPVPLPGPTVAVASAEEEGDAGVDTVGSAVSAAVGGSEEPGEHAAIEIIAITATATSRAMRPIWRDVGADGLGSIFMRVFLLSLAGTEEGRRSDRSRIGRSSTVRQHELDRVVVDAGGEPALARNVNGHEIELGLGSRNSEIDATGLVEDQHRADVVEVWVDPESQLAGG